MDGKDVADKGGAAMEDGDSLSLSVGPVHPALKEPVRFDFRIVGEKVVGVDFSLSQVHRGIEWMGMRRNPVQILYLAARICGICNICHTYAFCRAVEGIAGIEVPPRAHYIRTIASELERIHSHLLWAGIAAHELGFDSVMHYTWRVRENVLDAIEHVTGNRITKAIMTIGGVRRDMGEKQLKHVMECVGFYKKCFGKLSKIFLHDPVIKARTRDAGILSRQEGLRLCSLGPTARASGIKKDIRQDEPYGAYPDIGVSAVTPDQLTGEVRGDVYDRIAVRLLEVRQSAGILESCVKHMPPGKIAHEEKSQKLLAELRQVEGEGIGRHEAPRGEVFHYVKMAAGQDPPYAWKVRAPTYNNLLSWVPMLMGEQIADIPIVAASIDPCMSCTNRAVVTDRGKGSNARIIDQRAMHDLSVRKTREIKQRLGRHIG